MGSILCFCIARKVLPESRKTSILENATVKRVDKLLASSPVYYGTLFRLALVPTVVKNYGLALLNIDFGRYLTCCLLGSCVGVPSQAYLGSQLGDFYLGFKDAEALANTDPWILFGGCFPALAMLILMPTVARVLLGKDDDDESDKKEKDKTESDTT